MSKLRAFSICLSDIPKDKIIDHKNGKKYLNLATYDNDQPDKYGNDFGVYVQQTKEEREAKTNRTYIGNGKIVKADTRPTPSGKDAPVIDRPTLNDSDDLPF